MSLVDGSGAQLGQPATRATSTPTLVNINPGNVAHATLAVASAGNFDPSACSAMSTSLKVFPPNQTVALTAPFAAQTCGDFTVQAITTGAHDQ